MIKLTNLLVVVLLVLSLFAVEIFGWKDGGLLVATCDPDPDVPCTFPPESNEGYVG